MWSVCSTEWVSVFYRAGQCVLQSGSVCSIERVSVFHRAGQCVL